MDGCRLCELNLKDELVYYEDDYIAILQTKDMKGHKERLMVINKEHVTDVSWKFFRHTMKKTIEIGKKVFSYTPKFIIMDSTFSIIKLHWHLVCTDLDPNSDDYDQILRTEWIDAIDTK